MPTPSSSSSSSASRVATPVDDSHPTHIAFPTHSHRHAGLASSGSSALSLDRLGQGSTSRRRALSFTPRSPKVSLETSKAKPLPAVAVATTEYAPLGAFGPTSSAAPHLRALIHVSKFGGARQSRSSIDTDIYGSSSPSSPASTSVSENTRFHPSGRYRRSPIRPFSPSKTFLYDIDDSEPEHEANEDNDSSFWPPAGRRSNGGTIKRAKGRVAYLQDAVPIISRSPSTSPPKNDPGAFASRPLLVSRHSSASATSLSHARTASSPSNVANASGGSALAAASHYVRPRAGTTVQPMSPSKHLRPRDSLLRANSGPVPNQNHARKGSVDACSPSPIKSLNPALAAVEHASRLRTRCVCVVCGKPGVDFPRCPRCSVCWCTRECRMSEKEKLGKHVCSK